MLIMVHCKWIIVSFSSKFITTKIIVEYRPSNWVPKTLENYVEFPGRGDIMLQKGVLCVKLRNFSTEDFK